MPEHGSGDEHIFTVRLWREPNVVGPGDREWRGRLYHSQSKSSRNFVGLERLFDLIRRTLSGTGNAAPPAGPRR